MPRYVVVVSETVRRYYEFATDYTDESDVADEFWEVHGTPEGPEPYSEESEDCSIVRITRR